MIESLQKAENMQGSEGNVSIETSLNVSLGSTSSPNRQDKKIFTFEKLELKC